MGERILEFRDICKYFPGVKALDGVSFDIERGTCHGLVGENGAGKSTLIKILTGAYIKTSGTILYNGAEFAPQNTREAMNAGIGCLFQELNVVEQLRVEENICLGLETTKFGVIRKSERNKKVLEMLKRLDSSIRPDQYIEELSVAKRQVVEIAKALAMDSDVIIMDEPTAALSDEESRRLFEVIAELKAHGITIIYITHRLEEVMELADYVTVLRDGKHIATKPRAEVESRQELIKMMIGKIIVEGYHPNQADENVKLISAKNVTNRKLRDVSFDLFKGEILGFYGLIGAGKTEIARAIYGADSYEGEILVGEENAKSPTVWQSLQNGVALVPEERRTQGVCTSLSIASNTAMMNYKTVSRKGIVSKARQGRVAREYIGRIGTTCRDENQSVMYLSGGNQQKVAVSKCLNAVPKVLLLDEPTRGVDVGAKQEIYAIIRRLIEEGCSAIVFSSELPEILGLCDRIGLLNEGELVTILRNDDEIDTQKIMNIVTGGERNG